jgi:hypothetical protein
MTGDVVKIFKFGRFGKKYFLHHPTGKLTPIPGRFDGLKLWKEIVLILLRHPKSRLDDVPEKFDEGEFDDEEDNGTIKTFLFGRTVLVYSKGGVLYLRVGNKLEQIDNVSIVKQYWCGPLCFYSINCGRIRTFGIDTQWFEFISRYIDPTYDEIDAMAGDFAGYVKRMFEANSQ